MTTTQKPVADARLLDKLEWPLLLDVLAGFAQTVEGKDQCRALAPALDRDAIAARWTEVEPLKTVAAKGYKAPIGELVPLATVFRAAALGQMLDGASLRAVGDLLTSTRACYGFASDFAATCTTLRHVKGRILPMPTLLAAIDKAIMPDGTLRDDASPELTRLRRAKLSVRRRIEETITRLFRGSDLEKYLQDDFYTIRSERYVVPMRLDGRGRVKGSILDTSASGQTLFIEPAEITPINDQLLDLELEEKLEIARIFRDLSAMIAAEVEMLRANYAELIRLDQAMAEAHLAADIDAGPVRLSDRPTLDWTDARHPLIRRTQGRSPVGNTIRLEGEQSVLIVSGPNAGGKTIVLKTVGLLTLMAKAGLMVPAAAGSALYPFERLFLELGDAQSLTASLSTFSGHLHGLKPVLERAGPGDLALLDELAVGTDPETGAAIGTAILEDLADRRTTALVTTHFDALKGLAVSDRRFRNGSMEFSLSTLKPTYRLILDVPGQSYGLEVAEQIGLPARILQRARALRGRHASSLDQAVNELMRARDEVRSQTEAAAKSRLEAEAAKARWDQEVELLQDQRRKASRQLADKYESEIQELRARFDEHLRSLRQSLKAGDGGAPDKEAAMGARRATEQALRDMDNVVSRLAQGADVGDKLPGQPATRDNAKKGVPVFVLPVKKTGRVLRDDLGDDLCEVEVGILKMRLALHDLRVISEGEAGAAAGGARKPPVPAAKPKTGGSRGRPSRTTEEVPFVVQTNANTLDLRGRSADDAVRSLWDFLDRALLRGDEAVIVIHGHGEGTLKQAVRTALRESSPYELVYRPGLDQEGGDGVTAIRLRL